jgi:outer membrane protein
MFKKILLALAVCIPAIAFAQGKFGTVDVQTIMTEMPEYKAAQEQLATASKSYEDEFGKLKDELNKKYSELQALADDTPDAIKQRRYQEVSDFEQRIQTFAQSAQQDLSRQEQTLMQPVQEKLLNAIKSVGSQGGYTFIFQDGAPLYSGTDVTDITSAVKSQLGIK